LYFLETLEREAEEVDDALSWIPIFKFKGKATKGVRIPEEEFWVKGYFKVLDV
jgi:hypothetical protein